MINSLRMIRLAESTVADAAGGGNGISGETREISAQETDPVREVPGLRELLEAATPARVDERHSRSAVPHAQAPRSTYGLD